MSRLAALLLVALTTTSGLAARGWAANVLAQRKASTQAIASSRFSIYPKAAASQSLKATIKRAVVSGIGGLGLAVEADDVSSLVTGAQDNVFEAMQGCLARAAAVEGHPHVSMQFTISSDVWEETEAPVRSSDADNWAAAPLPRVACQFSVYSLFELGSCEESIVELAAQSPSFVGEKPLCTSMLDGTGDEVFRVLQESYELACSRSVSGHVVMTATLTANKASWKGDEELEADRAAVEASASASLAEDFQALMRTRRTVNDFEPALPVGWEGAIERAVHAAVMAPNHRRTEPWRFQLLGQQRIRAICELNAQLVRESGKGEEAAQKKLTRWLAMPGWLVVTRALTDDEVADRAQEGSEGGEGGEGGGGDAMAEAAGVPREDYAAVCCAIQNLCLSLHSEGLGTKWTSGPVNFDPRFAEAAGLPKGEEVVGTLWFGTPEKVPEPPKKRLGMAEVLRRTD